MDEEKNLLVKMRDENVRKREKFYVKIKMADLDRNEKLKNLTWGSCVEQK